MNISSDGTSHEQKGESWGLAFTMGGGTGDKEWYRQEVLARLTLHISQSLAGSSDDIRFLSSGWGGLMRSLEADIIFREYRIKNGLYEISLSEDNATIDFLKKKIELLRTARISALEVLRKRKVQNILKSTQQRVPIRNMDDVAWQKEIIAITEKGCRKILEARHDLQSEVIDDIKNQLSWLYKRLYYANSSGKREEEDSLRKEFLKYYQNIRLTYDAIPSGIKYNTPPSERDIYTNAVIAIHEYLIEYWLQWNHHLFGRIIESNTPR